MAEDRSQKWIIERLRKDHDRSNFDSGVPSVDDFLKERATQFQKRGLGRTFVAVAPGCNRVLGFYTLSSGAVSFDKLPTKESRSLPSRIPIPVLHVGQLAVDKSNQGQGLGSFLLLDALRRGLRHADEVAMRAVEVYAINDEARQFYRKYGFVELLDDEQHLYIPMKKVAKLFPEEAASSETVS